MSLRFASKQPNQGRRNGVWGRTAAILDRVSLAGLDPYLRVGVAAAIGGALVGIAVVIAVRTDSKPQQTAAASQSQPAEPVTSNAADGGEPLRATLVFPDTEVAYNRPLDEIPPEPVIDRQPRAETRAMGQPQDVGETEPPYTAEPMVGNAVTPEAGDAAIAMTVKPVPAPESVDETQLARLTAPPKPPPAPVLDTGAPMIALVIDDMGLDRRRSRRTVALPGPLTLAYLTYAEDLPQQTAAAAAQGHELMLHVAMEPTNPDIDAGPDVLLTDHDEDEILRRLRRGLDRFDGFVGINNHMGSKFTADTASLMTVMAELQRRGLFFLDSRTSAASVADRVAFEFGVPFAVRNVFLDDTDDQAGVARRLAETERIAREQGHAIAIGHPKDKTLEALEAWIPGVTERGLRLVPMSAIIAALSAPRP